MSTLNTKKGMVGLAVAALAALSVTACDPYIQANKSAPVVIGVAVVDMMANQAIPIAAPSLGDTCVPPYPTPDSTWAASAFPGLCNPDNLAKGFPTVCPVMCYPPRSGPAYAPFYQGNLGGAYQYTIPGGTASYTYELPADGKFTVRHVPPGYAPAPNDAFKFAQIYIAFNKLMDGRSIQPNPNDPARCIPATGANGPKVYKITPASSAGIGTDVTETELWSICYDPNSAATYWGGAMTLTPNSNRSAATNPGLTPDTKYTVQAVVLDQQGNSVTVDVTVITDPLPAAAPVVK